MCVYTYTHKQQNISFKEGGIFLPFSITQVNLEDIMLSIMPKFKRVELMSNVFIINKRRRKESFRGDC